MLPRLLCATQVAPPGAVGVERVVLARVHHDVGAALARECAAARGQVGGDHGLHPGGLEHQDHRQPDRAAADHHGDLTRADLAAPYGVVGDRERLHQRGVVVADLVGHREREGLGDQHLLGVRPRRLGRETGELDTVGRAEHGQRHHPRAGRPPAPGLGPVRRHPPDELVPQHDPVLQPHEVGVAHLAEGVGGDVAVGARVQVGAADSTAQDVEQDLAGPGLEVGDVGDVELAFVGGDGSHRPESGIDLP
jgi:hypothetical protein